MVNYDEIIKEVEQQENELQFNEFTNATALNIGLSLVDRAKKENKSITIEINRNGHQLFHYSCEGTSPDNDQWVARKCNVVRRFNHSSHYMWAKVSQAGTTLEDRFKVSSAEFASSGGAFPVIVKNVGVIGAIAVSGMAQEVDHQWVVDAIRAYIGK
ncbi:MAG TPA: heme-degrading domain-containing protein [Mobilitalea sp.]|nr:heme-degrading domain-containing protein [Mobilitalea sp.]